MPDKQDRYRKRKTEQGLQRVEVLVPGELVPHLKAYARALRDTHALGAEPPLFDGMWRAARGLPQPMDLDAASTLRKNEGLEQDHSKGLHPTMPQPRQTAGTAKTRPDFSKGLLDD